MAEEQREMHPAFEEILLDIAQQEKRADKAKALETKHELANNVWPMFKALAEATNTRFEELEDAVEEYLAEEGNVLYADLAEPLFGLIALAKKVGATLTSDAQMTDLQWQALRNDAKAMLQTAAILEPIAAQAVVTGDADDEEEGDGGEPGEEEEVEDDEDGGDDPDDGEPAAAKETP